MIEWRSDTPGMPVTEADVRRFEELIGWALPGDFRQLLLQHNGKRAVARWYECPSLGSVAAKFGGFDGVNWLDPHEPDRDIHVLQPEAGFLSIAAHGGILLGSDGAIYCRLDNARSSEPARLDQPALVKVADSWSQYERALVPASVAESDEPARASSSDEERRIPFADEGGSAPASIHELRRFLAVHGPIVTELRVTQRLLDDLSEAMRQPPDGVRMLSIARSTFDGDINLSAVPCPLRITTSRMHGALHLAGDVSLRITSCTVDGDMGIVDAHVRSPMGFEHTTFAGAFVARGCEFHSVDFAGASFARPVVFEECSFAFDLSFREATFHDHVTFRHCRFASTIAFTRAQFHRGVELAECTFAEPPRLGGAVHHDPTQPFDLARVLGTDDAS